MNRFHIIAFLVLPAMTPMGCSNPSGNVSQATSPMTQRFDSPPPDGDIQKLNADLLEAQDSLARNPDDPARLLWVGRRLAYLWRMNEAIDIFAKGIEKHPNYAPFYRHRGHRYISVRRFDDAIADLEHAAKLIEGKPEEIEQDGAPNLKNIPLTTTGYNVWYHLALAHYLKGDYETSFSAWRQCLAHARGMDDNVAAVVDWVYMTLRRMGRDRDAEEWLTLVRDDAEIIENTAYHRRVLMYKGKIKPEELLNVAGASAKDIATLGYGLGNYYWCNGQRDEAVAVWKKVVAGPYWPAFGHIAAELELQRIDK